MNAWSFSSTPPNPQPATRFYYQRTASIEPHHPRDFVTYRRIDTLLLFPEKSPSDANFDQYPCAFHHFCKNALFVANSKTIFRITFSSIFLPTAGNGHLGRASLPTSLSRAAIPILGRAHRRFSGPLAPIGGRVGVRGKAAELFHVRQTWYFGPSVHGARER